MFKQTLIFLVCALALTSCAVIEEENDVLILTKDNFDQALSTYENVLVEFYAPWCGHCKRLEPEYAKAASYFKEQGNKIRLAKVDATVEEELAEKYEVHGFPTLNMFIKGESSPYSGGRNAQGIVGWIKKKVEVPSIYIEKVQDVDAIIQKAELIVLFYGDELDTGFQMYKTVASNNMEVPFFHTLSKEIMDKYNPNGDVKISLLRNFDEPRLDFDDIYTPENIEKFVLNNRYPRIVEYVEKYARVIFGEGQPAIFLMTGRGLSSTRAEEAFVAAANKIQTKLLFTVCDTEDELCQKVAKYFGLLREEVPAVYIFRPATQKERAAKFLLEDLITLENIEKFVQDYDENKLVALPKSEEVPFTNDDYVKLITGKTYRDIVHDENKDVIVFYSDTNCYDCREYLTLFNGFARLTNSIQDLIIGKIDLDKNDVAGLSFTTIPQIVLYPRDQKSNPITYTGGRDIKELYEFFKERLTVDYNPKMIRVDEMIETIRREAEEKKREEEISRKRMQDLEASQAAQRAAEEAAEGEKPKPIDTDL
jgi:protein disulfide-isomerase A1